MMKMREKILEAALKLYTSKPPQNVTTKEIAKAAGVSIGLVFHYFKNKDELEREGVSYFIEKYAFLEAKDVREFVEKNLKFAKENPGIFRFLQYVFEKEKYAGSKDLALKVYEDGLKRLREMLQVENPEKIATLLMAMIDGLAMYSFLLDLDVEEFADTIVELIGCYNEVPRQDL